MKGHKVALGGSYSGNTAKLFKSLSKHGVLQFSLVGREVTLQVKSETLDDVIASLNKLGVDNINILEWKKYGTTVTASGSGSDNDEVVNVSLIPSTLGEGLRQLSTLLRVKIDDNVRERLIQEIEETLVNAGVTDVLYVLQVDGESSEDDYVNAVREASLNALFNAGGIMGIE
ncbi:MAG: hypothetical protein ABIH11_03355 [Candidatus Altiarchaeota archaeon]